MRRGVVGRIVRSNTKLVYGIRRGFGVGIGMILGSANFDLIQKNAIPGYFYIVF